MEAWKSSCPRLTVWEDAVTDGLVEIRRGEVRLTQRGESPPRYALSRASVLLDDQTESDELTEADRVARLEHCRRVDDRTVDVRVVVRVEIADCPPAVVAPRYATVGAADTWVVYDDIAP